MRIFGLILAGGAGRRMGGADKALLPLAGQPLVTHAINRLAPQVERLAISANGDPDRLAFARLPVMADSQPGRGPLQGVLDGLHWAAEGGAEALATVAVDSPLFPPDLVARLAGGAPSAAPRIAYAFSDGREHPTFALWPLAAAHLLADWLEADQRRMMGFLHSAGARAVDLPPGSIANFNTPEDLAVAEARLAAGLAEPPKAGPQQ